MFVQKSTLFLFIAFALVVLAVEWWEMRTKVYDAVLPTQQVPSGISNMVGSRDSSITCDPNIVYRAGGLPAITDRSQFGSLLELKQFERGAEVGVQRGIHASQVLNLWASCKYFALVDLWKQQENYVDAANVDDTTQEACYQDTRNRLAPWQNKTHFFRMLSVEAALLIDDNSLDFVYIDARHDYCGCMEDMLAYWPKLRPGGVLAGHDYMTNEEVKQASSNQDFGLCMNGTRNEGAVRGAVQDFALAHGLTISVTYKDGGVWSSWMVQKPTLAECVRV